MIERLDIKDYENKEQLVWFGVINKLNELVDAVNVLQAQVAILQEHAHPTAKTLADPYAEQRKWIGCVCRFWFDNPNDTVLDYLGKIQTGENGIEYYGKETYDWFPHCEPILPTDNAIYKGGDNE